jgi:probable addiction module antidote protein
MPLKTSHFDPAEYLQTDEEIKIFLQDAAEGTPEEFIHALNTAARAKGMTELARQAGVTRASLYKSLADDGNPRFETVAKIVNALGCKLAVV